MTLFRIIVWQENPRSFFNGSLKVFLSKSYYAFFFKREHPQVTMGFKTKMVIHDLDALGYHDLGHRRSFSLANTRRCKALNLRRFARPSNKPSGLVTVVTPDPRTLKRAFGSNATSEITILIGKTSINGPFSIANCWNLDGKWPKYWFPVSFINSPPQRKGILNSRTPPTLQGTCGMFEKSRCSIYSALIDHQSEQMYYTVETQYVAFCSLYKRSWWLYPIFSFRP